MFTLKINHNQNLINTLRFIFQDYENDKYIKYIQFVLYFRIIIFIEN